MRMSVRDRLAGLTACIEDNAIPGLRDALRHGYFVRLGDDLGQQPVTGRSQAHQVRIVRFRNDQYVDRCLRIDVAKCKRALSFEHPRRRDVAGHDFAKQAVGHGPILTCDVLTRLTTYKVAARRTCSAPQPERPVGPLACCEPAAKQPPGNRPWRTVSTASSATRDDAQGGRGALPGRSVARPDQRRVGAVGFVRPDRTRVPRATSGHDSG